MWSTKPFKTRHVVKCGKRCNVYLPRDLQHIWPHLTFKILFYDAKSKTKLQFGFETKLNAHELLKLYPRLSLCFIIRIITGSPRGKKRSSRKRMKSLKGHDEVITLKSIRYRIHRLKN